VIDEMPFGNFCEIEGSEASSIQQAAASLGLDWDARIVASYVALFDLLKLKRQLKVNQLTFQELADLTVTPDELGVRPADQEAG